MNSSIIINFYQLKLLLKIISSYFLFTHQLHLNLNPYFLLTNENYSMMTKEEYPQIENIFICKQDTLFKHEPCLYKLQPTTGNQCPETNTYYKRVNIQNLNEEEILVILFKETIIENKGQQGIHSIDALSRSTTKYTKRRRKYNFSMLCNCRNLYT